MDRKKYAEYSYIDENNIYTYEDGITLKNKFGITDPKALIQKEYEISSMRIFDLILFPIKVFTVNDICKIHEFIFKDLYEWAGEFRKVNISKEGKAFMSMQSFGAGSIYINDLINKFHKNTKRKEDIIKLLAEILDNINYLHAFREGNGRTQREVLRVLALSKGYKLLINVDQDEEVYELYMQGTVNSDVKLLERLIERLLMAI